MKGSGSQQQTNGASTHARPRVFITDPSPAVIDRLVRLIEDIALVVGHATNARDTLSALRAAQPQLAVFDVAMTHGVELLIEIKQRSSGLIVAVLTHSADDTTRRRCLQLGADYFLDKLHDTPTLRQIVSGLHDSRPAH